MATRGDVHPSRDGGAVSLVTIGRTEAEASRRPVDDVLGTPSGPSRRGSTFWNRVFHCPFEHFLANELGWQNVMPHDPLDTGILWHAAKEAYYRAALAWQDRMRAQAPDLDPRDPHFLRGHDAEGQRAAFEVVQLLSREPGYEKIYETLSLMLDAYFERYRSDMWEIVDVEVTLESNRYGFEYSSRLDLFVIDHQPAAPVLRVVEHKSSMQINSLVTEGYTMDLQTMGQVWLVWTEVDLAQYPPFMGSLINITSKNKVPKTERVPLMPTEPMLQTFARSVHALSDALLDAWPRYGYPRNFAACTRRYGRCEFFNLCRNNPEFDAAHARATDAAGDIPLGYRRRLPVVEGGSSCE